MSRLGFRGQHGAERTESSLRSPAPPVHAFPNSPRNILPQRSVLATTLLHGDISVSQCQLSPSRVPRLSAVAFMTGTVHPVGLYRICPEPSGIFLDQGSIENTLSPASLTGGFLTTGPPGRDVPSEPSKIIYPETLNVILQIIGPSQLK